VETVSKAGVIGGEIERWELLVGLAYRIDWTGGKHKSAEVLDMLKFTVARTSKRREAYRDASM
jgi:hypothetical protein